MAYVPGSRYDVFVSYASADNVRSRQYPEGWITDFVRSLEVALLQRLGGPNELAIYIDQRELSSNDELNELLRAVEASAVFLSICSRSYAQRKWTVKELEHFEQSIVDSKRLFAVEILPLGSDESYPPPLASRRRLPFYKRSSTLAKVSVPLEPQDPEYGLLIHDLAEQIRHQLLALRAVSDVREATREIRQATGSFEGGRLVLLAQVTEDLDHYREQLRRYLEQFGHKVVPEGSYRQDGPGFKLDVAADLANAELFVQLLGPIKGRTPPDLPQGYARTQLEMAVEHGVEVMQWRSTTVDQDSIEDRDYREFLNGTTVTASGFESFKSCVHERLERQQTPATGAGDRTLPMVFINADGADMEYAQHVRDEFVRNGFFATIPLANPAQGELQEFLRENLLDCDALILLYGNATHVWADRNLRFFNKLRAQRRAPPKIVAVLIGPPPENLHALGAGMPGLQVLGSSEEWNSSSVEEVIRALSK